MRMVYLARVQRLQHLTHSVFVRSYGIQATSKGTPASTGLDVRNLGIIAHIDAGKTTTTERMLYFSGYIPRLGDVDEGNTVMDYLPAERERGITIQSAAITFPWREHKLNLIDTPGHADFTFEVERSLRVLDGAITILDAVAGVEAQTEKVWKQANARQISRLVFVNKMDRVGAGFGRTVSEVANKLRARPLVLQLPIFSNGLDQGDFLGVVDLLSLKCLVWPVKSDGKEVNVSEIKDYDNEMLIQEVSNAREALVETLSELDETVVDAYLEYEEADKIPIGTLKRAIRKLCLSGHLVPILLGASFRNIGVQPLLDAVVDYLPSPADRPPPTAFVDGKAEALKQDSMTSALAFKVIIDPQRGPMVFVRVYSGTLTRGSTLYNTSTKTKERAVKLLQMYADEARELESVSAGNIAVILGLKDTKTGDTLILAKDSKKELQLQPIEIPPPVFIATLETNSLSESKLLELALSSLLREDPSLRVTFDEDTGQTLLSGMGELHLEIAGNRLINDFKAKTEIGKLRIGYRETVDGHGTLSEVYERTTTNGKSSIELSVSIAPLTDEDNSGKAGTLVDGNLIDIALPSLPHSDFGPEEASLSLRNGVSAALTRGLVLGYPLHSVHASVVVSRYEADTTLGILAGAARHLTAGTLAALGESRMSVLEPIMQVSVSVDGTNMGTVINDLTGARGGQILSLDEAATEDSATGAGTRTYTVYAPPDSTSPSSTRGDSTDAESSGTVTRVIHARVPLKEMIGYSRSLRTLTGGRGSFTMSVDTFQPMTRRALQQLRQAGA